MPTITRDNKMCNLTKKTPLKMKASEMAHEKIILIFFLNQNTANWISSPSKKNQSGIGQDL